MLYVPVKFQKEKPQEELIERIEELRSKLENTPIGTNNQIVLWEISKNILSLIESLHKVDQHELACLILLRSLWERTIDFCYLAHSLFNEENLPQRYLAGC